MIFDTSQNPAYLAFMTDLTGTKDFGPCKTIAILDDTLLAVVLYNGLDESNIGMSIASTTPSWCTRQVIKVCFGFPFIQLGLNRVTSLVRENNTKSRSLAERLGFGLEGEMKQYYENGESAMIYGLLKNDCRWV